MVENFTATWCAYCPYQAQAISQLESVYGESLVVIKYHPSTSDPFYNSNSATRSSYYAVPGLPTSLIQGNKAVVGGWDGVYTPLRSYVVSSFAGESPCSLYVEIGEYNTSTRQAQVKVKVFMTSNQFIRIPSQLKLRVAILEDSIMYNWQNMNVLRYVVRGMWPNAAGTPLSLGYGDSAVYSFIINISNPVRAPYYYVAAFVQSDSTYSIHDYYSSYTLNAGNIIQASKARLGASGVTENSLIEMGFNT
ncbi:MAG: thioredoxin family protein, partial [candidate division WOR-3 bacterium]